MEFSTKQLWDHTVADSAIQVIDSATFDFVIFLSSGDDISATSDSTNNSINGTARQVADVNGNLINPSGFNPQ